MEQPEKVIVIKRKECSDYGNDCASMCDEYKCLRDEEEAAEIRKQCIKKGYVKFN